MPESMAQKKIWICGHLGRDTVYYNDVNILAERTKIFEMKIV